MLIESGELQPGSPISVRTLAERLEMSTLPVSSALQSLVREGLVVSRNRSGSSIAVITPQDIWNTVQYRLAMEQRGAWLACRLATSEELSYLQTLAPKADGEGILSKHELVDADDRFHQALQQCSHTPGLFLPPSYLRIFQLKLMMCSGLQLFPEYAPNGERQYASGHRLIAEVAATRNVERLNALQEIHICRLIGLPELASLQENANEKIKEIRMFLSRNTSSRQTEAANKDMIFT